MTKEEQILQLVSEGWWLNHIVRTTGCNHRVVRKTVHDAGKKLKPAPQSARGSQKWGRPLLPGISAISDPETEWRGRKAQARW